jgi:hypothetical protein
MSDEACATISASPGLSGSVRILGCIEDGVPSPDGSRARGALFYRRLAGLEVADMPDAP